MAILVLRPLDDFADGTLKWTDTATVYVLASETGATDAQEWSVTDYAFSSVPHTYSLPPQAP